jgi:hypothetical protein
MAIIYTYPDLGAVDGSEKLLVTDGTDENNTKTVTTAAYGAYINATYGGGSASTIYQSNGGLTSDRSVSGNGYSLSFNTLDRFFELTATTGNISIATSEGGDVKIGGYGGALDTGEIQIRNELKYDWSGASPGLGKVLTSNAIGKATWQTPATVTVSGTAGRITTTGTTSVTIDIDASYVGQASITTLGTITTGTWQGSTIETTYGGTGQTSYTNGDILIYDSSSSSTLTKLPIGSTGKVLTVSGGLPSWQSISGSSLTNVTTTYTVLSTDETVNCTSISGFTVNLTTAVGEVGRKIVIKNSGTGDILVDADGAETIDDALTATLVQYESITVQSDGTNWIII